MRVLEGLIRLHEVVLKVHNLQVAPYSDLVIDEEPLHFGEVDWATLVVEVAIKFRDSIFRADKVLGLESASAEERWRLLLSKPWRDENGASEESWALSYEVHREQASKSMTD